VDRLKSPKVIVINETDSDRSAERVAEWLVQHYPGLKVIQLATIKHKNRVYQRASFQTTNGQQKVVFFDVTSTFKNNMNTAMRIFQAGTMIRLWPGTGSTPTKMQILVQ
jgi:hypothetical protein